MELKASPVSVFVVHLVLLELKAEQVLPVLLAKTGATASKVPLVPAVHVVLLDPGVPMGTLGCLDVMVALAIPVCLEGMV
jgi:hypothetical protein